MTSKVEYCTCEHLKRDAVRGACKVVTTFAPGSLGGPDEGQWLACTRCDLRGSRMDPSYMDHFLSQKHFVGVRLQQPQEMFCVACGDYQYHSDFDRRLGLSRLSRWGEPAAGAVSPPPAGDAPRAATPGFVNMGNTCFLSSVMQVLLHNEVLRRYYGAAGGPAAHVGAADPSPPCIACSVQDMYRAQGSCSSLAPSGLLHAMWTQFSHMAAYEQQDAHEFLVALLDGLSTHLHRHHAADCSVLQHFMPPLEEAAPASSGSPAADPPRQEGAYYSTGHFRFHGIVNEAFSGVLRSDLACGSCAHRSFKFEPFRDISLSLGPPGLGRAAGSADGGAAGSADGGAAKGQSPKRRRVGSAEGVLRDVPDLPDELFLGDDETPPAAAALEAAAPLSLDDCFRQFTSPEHLSERRQCESCGASSAVTKQMSLFSPPNVLVLHLKRFDAFGLNKVRAHVSMPTRDLDLGRFFSAAIDGAASARPAAEGVRSMMFDLHGVVCHKGDSLSQGHYVCYVLSENGEESSGAGSCWVRCDDERTTIVPVEEVEACEGYILFYVNKATKDILGASTLGSQNKPAPRHVSNL